MADVERRQIMEHLMTEPQTIHPISDFVKQALERYATSHLVPNYPNPQSAANVVVLEPNHGEIYCIIGDEKFRVILEKQ